MKPLRHRLRDFLKYRTRPVRGWIKHTLIRPVIGFRPPQPLKLHLGSGKERLDGWVNIDLQKLPEVDLAADVTRGLPFKNAAFVFAEHFLEHLEVRDALDFLAEAHRVLADDGVLRLSTPNLDWVWTHVYRPGPLDRDDAAEALISGIRANRAFYGWEHRFLWNRPLLEEALLAVGFRDLRTHRHGESEIDELRGIERHETYPDSEELPHILLIEARKGSPDAERMKILRARLHENLLDYLGN